MKTLIGVMAAILMTGCSTNAQVTSFRRLSLVGDSLPTIRHIIDMKMSGDTLYFVYETENGFGQRFLRRAVIDRENAMLDICPEIGKRDDGYYVSYMPYPFWGPDGNVRVVGQDDSEIYDLSDGNTLTRTKKYLVSGSSSIPFPLSQHVQDVSMISTDNYVFIGREPNGGSQYAMTANTVNEKVDIIRRIAISPELQAWMSNAGELAYSHKHNRLAFAYRLHPVVEIFDTDGNIIKSVRIGEDTFDSQTLEEADFESRNVLHTVDVASTSDCIYALYWGCKYSEAAETTPTIYKIDWNGNIISCLSNLPMPLYKVAVSDDNSIFGWTGKDFILLSNP